MAHSDTPTRASTSLALTATTLMALAAMVAEPAPLAGESRGGPADAVRTLGESPAMRAVAAAMAAAARDLLRASPTPVVVAPAVIVTTLPATLGCPRHPDASSRTGPPPLGESLIDIPPPGC